MILNTEYSNR